MTDVQLATLTSALHPAGECHLAGLPHAQAPDLAAALRLPCHAYEGREEGCYACRPGSFALALVEAAQGDERRTLARLAFALEALAPGGLLVLDIHPGDLTGPLARTLTAAAHPVFFDGLLAYARRLPAPDARRAYGALPRGALADTLASGPLPTPAADPAWRKVRPDADEYAAAAGAARDALAFRPPAPPPGLRPLLPPADGHLAQLLGTGLLDGQLALADGRRVVVRGFAGKTSYRKATPPLTATGRVCENSSSTTVYGERPYLGIRLVDESGRFESYATASGGDLD